MTTFELKLDRFRAEQSAAKREHKRTVRRMANVRLNARRKFHRKVGVIFNWMLAEITRKIPHKRMRHLPPQ